MTRVVTILALFLGCAGAALSQDLEVDIERPVTLDELDAINLEPILTISAECQHARADRPGPLNWDLTVYLANEGSLNVPAGRLHVRWWDWEADDYGPPVERVYPPLGPGFIKHVFKFQIEKQSVGEDLRAFQVLTSNRTFQGVCPCLRVGRYACGEPLPDFTGGGCGLGPELVVVMPALLLLRRRRSRSAAA